MNPDAAKKENRLFLFRLLGEKWMKNWENTIRRFVSASRDKKQMEFRWQMRKYIF